MDKIKIIFDTDIGDDIDDAFALAMLLNSPEVEILGVTTVYRNAELRAKIVSHLLNLYGKKIGVYMGEDNPIQDPIAHFSFESIGKDGKPIIPHYSEEMESAQIEEKIAVDFLLETIEENPGEIVVLAIGPLTNLALARRKNPEVFSKIKSIYLMGGEILGVNKEWNFVCDTVAAEEVLKSGVDIKMYPLNVTRPCILTKEVVDHFCSLKDAGNVALAKMLQKWLKDNEYKKNPTMHDGLAAVGLFHTFCKMSELSFAIYPDGVRGLIRPVFTKEQADCTVQVATLVDYAGFIEFLKERIRDVK